MKKALIVITLACIAILYVGYYETRYVEDNKMVFFIKKAPTLQVEFVNLFANDADNKKVHELDDEERQVVIDYCKYRLGIETELKTQEELEICKQR